MNRALLAFSLFGVAATVVLGGCREYCGQTELLPGEVCCDTAGIGPDGRTRTVREPYSPSSELCCDGFIVPLVDNDMQTCADVVYCGEDVIAPGTGEACCYIAQGSFEQTPFAYRTDEATCCSNSGGLEYLVYEPDAACEPCTDGDRCCGQAALPDDAFCCESDFTEDIYFFADAHACCGGEVVPVEQYVADTAFCEPTICDGEPLMPGDACCGRTVHDPAVQQCCLLEGYDPFLVAAGQTCTPPTRPLCGAVELTDGQTCCGDARVGVAYDPATQICCPGDTPRAVPLDAECNDTPPPVLCGGAALPDGQACCGDATTGTAYNPANGRCCPGATPRVIAVDASCDDTPPPVLCGGTALPDGRTCCGNATVGTAYDTTTTQCCDASTGETAALGEVCDSSPTLCGGAALPDDRACCGSVAVGSTYDPTTQQCCDPSIGRVASLSESCTPGDSYSTWGFATPCGDHIYFSDYGRGIRRIDPATLRVELFQTAGFVLGSVCNGTELIYTDIDAGIFRAPLSGEAPTLLVGDADTRAYDLVIADGALFWNRNEVTSDIWRYPLAGGSVTTIAESQGSPPRLATGGAYIYWADRTELAPRVRRARADGTSADPELVMDGFLAYELLNEMTILDGTLYVASRDLRVVSGPAAGGSPFTLISGAEGQPANIAIDGAYVYWRDDTNGSVRRRALDLSTPVETAATAPEFAGGPGDFVILDGTIYTFDSITYTVVRATP